MNFIGAQGAKISHDTFAERCDRCDFHRFICISFSSTLRNNVESSGGDDASRSLKLNETALA
jgi:hypothetical protein